MAQHTPLVHNEVLTFPSAAAVVPIPVGSAAWGAWLADPATTHFRFTSAAGDFTARREAKPGGLYWYAYRRQGGRLHKRYLGRASDLTLERLQAVAALLATPDAPSPDSSPPPLLPPPLAPGPASLILSTKLQMPPPRPDRVPRPRLLQRLNAGLAGRISLISAPAGFGKTTLLSDWLRAEPPRGPGRRVAWLALDAGDSDPIHFLRYLVAALAAIAPGVGATVRALLQASQLPPMLALLTSLVNDLAALPEAGILVLDDYHAVQGTPVHEILTFLTEHLPTQLHLVIATREDPPLPLARLRARQEITELRAADLRFSADEAAAFLRSVMGLDLSVSEVAALEARTEGWIAGLQLAALSMRDQADVPGFIAAFTGSHRYILDYLIDEVLSRQPAAIQDFLVRTSLLDRLCAPLCAAVLGMRAAETGLEATAQAEAMLQQIERANLFLIPLDTERRWYRYHALFADLLRAQLRRTQATAVPALHRRASAWYEAAGLWEAAIKHALAAPDYARAARLIERSAETLWMQGELTTLQGWLDALPEEITQDQPRLLLTRVWTRHLLELPGVEALLTTAAQALADTATPAAGPAAELRGMLAAIRAAIGGRQNAPAHTIALTQEALAHLPATNGYWRSAALIDLGRAYIAAGEWEAASRTLNEVRMLAQTTGNHYTALVAAANLARSQVAQGRLQEAAALYREELARTAQPDTNLVLHTGHLHVELGQLLYEWDDLPAATEHVQAGLERGQHMQPSILLDGYTTLALVKQAQGDPSGAGALLERAAQVAATLGLPAALSYVETYWVRLWLQQGQPPDGARRAARWGEAVAQRAAEPVTPPTVLDKWEQRILAGLYIAVGRINEGLHILARLAEEAGTARSWESRIETYLLQALAWQAQGTRTQAGQALGQALALAEPAGYVRLFVDWGAPVAALLRDVPPPPDLAPYVATVLAHFESAPAAGGTRAAPAQAIFAPLPTTEPLTERERAVLRLLVAGQSGPTIAASLVVGHSTVKTHLKSIYSKLDVHSRDQAIARAQELHLL